jgi:hypothetical protein
MLRFSAEIQLDWGDGETLEKHDLHVCGLRVVDGSVARTAGFSLCVRS